MAKKQINVTDVTIEKVNIESSFGKYDLVPHLEELNIYESIFSNHLQAHITLQDAFNIPFKLPIIAEETINVVIRMTGDGGDVIINPPMLHVHDLADRFLKTNQSQRFSLNLVSAQYMSNVHSRVSKSFSGMTAEDIVHDIWANYLDDGHGDLYTEPSKREEQCIIPNWTPHQAFNWLAGRARSAEYDTAVNYLFYETMNSVNFACLGDLADTGRDEPVLTFTQEPRVKDPTNIEGFSGGKVRIDNLTFINHFDRIKNAKRGEYASKLVTHDIVTKKIEQHDYNGLNEWAAYVHTSDFPAIPYSDVDVAMAMMKRTSLAPSEYKVTEGERLDTFTDSSVSFYPKHSQMFAQTPGHKYDNQAELWKLQRAGQMSLYDGYTMQIQCAGLPMLRVGHIVKVLVASTEGTSSGKEGSHWTMV